MGKDKTVAERLREKPEGRDFECWLAKSVLGFNCSDMLCAFCHDKTANALADMIEAEQAELRKQLDFERDAAMKERDCLCKRIEELEKTQSGVDVDALLRVANSIGYETQHDKDLAEIPNAQLCLWVDRIRDAVKNAKPQLPEGVTWPRYEDGELVKFWDKFVDRNGTTCTVSHVNLYPRKFALVSYEAPAYESAYELPVKRPEPEVLDADGVPIKVGDTVYDSGGNAYTALRFEQVFRVHVLIEPVDDTERIWADPKRLTHRKPDTQEAIDDDATMPYYTYCSKVLKIKEAQTTEEMVTAMAQDLLARQRKLLGGE